MGIVGGGLMTTTAVHSDSMIFEEPSRVMWIPSSVKRSAEQTVLKQIRTKETRDISALPRSRHRYHSSSSEQSSSPLVVDSNARWKECVKCVLIGMVLMKCFMLYLSYPYITMFVDNFRLGQSWVCRDEVGTPLWSTRITWWSLHWWL